MGDETAAELRTIVARLEVVEKQNRRLKRVILLTALTVGAMLLMGQARSPQIVEAEKFILKDGKGNTRARLEMEYPDKPVLALLDEKGFPRVSLGAGDAPLLTLCSLEPSSSAVTRVGCDDQVQIGGSTEQYGVAIYGRDSGPPFHGIRAGFSVVNGSPALDLFGQDSKARASLVLNTLGPDFQLEDKEGFVTEIGSIFTDKNYKGTGHGIVLLGNDGKMLWSAP